KVKTPYNVPSLTQKAALDALANRAVFEENMATILAEKATLIKAFEASAVIKKIYPSDTNFVLVEVTDAQTVYNELVKHDLVVRNQDKVIKNCLRITVGAPEENKKLIAVLKTITA